MSEHAGAWDDFRAKWLAAEPETRLAATFVPALYEPRAEALHVLRFELADAAFGIRDANVAQAKLGWWLGEIDALAAGHARHPVTRRLGDVAPAADHAKLAAVVAGAGAVARAESAESLAGLLMVVRRFSDAWGRAVGAQPDDALDAARAAAVIVGALRHWPRFAAAEHARVPLDFLARHGVNRAQLTEPAHARAAEALQRELLRALELKLAAAPRSQVPADAAWLAARRVLAAHLLRDVPRVASGQVAPLGLRALFSTWRAARAIHG